jgi:hypothetical protein
VPGSISAIAPIYRFLHVPALSRMLRSTPPDFCESFIHQRGTSIGLHLGLHKRNVRRPTTCSTPKRVAARNLSSRCNDRGSERTGVAYSPRGHWTGVVGGFRWEGRLL